MTTEATMTYLRVPIDQILDKYGIAGVHPAAALLPLMGDEEFQNLCADVTRQGFLNPVRVDDENMLIDGRNRLQAGWALGLDPAITRYQPVDTVAYVISENIMRRHLTPSQRAVLANEMAGLSRGRPSENAPAGAFSAQKDAAEQLGVSRRHVQRAAFVEENAPELLPEVKSGDLGLEEAHRKAKKQKTQKAAQNPVEAENPKPSPVMLTLRTHTGEEVPYPQPKGKHTFMETNDNVDWARYTWNPVTGCLHGCDYCYARDLALSPSFKASYPVGFTPLFHSERLDDPVNTNRPQLADIDPRYGRVFVGSMTDLFGEWVPKDWIDAVFEATLKAPDWEYLFLTKFPQRYRRIGLPPSCWFGTSVDSQKRVKTAERAMAQLDVKVRWLSIEPLLEPVQFSDLSWCDLMVIGAQTGTRQPDGYHPGFAPDFRWVASLVAQADAAGVPVYLKPNLMGEVSDQEPGMRLPVEEPRQR